MKNKSSKRYRKLLEMSKDKKIETIKDAIKKVKENCTTKFDESIDVSLSLNLKKKKYIQKYFSYTENNSSNISVARADNYNLHNAFENILVL